jgi:hypothetical protein
MRNEAIILLERHIEAWDSLYPDDSRKVASQPLARDGEGVRT